MSETDNTGYGVWANFERDREIFEARRSGATFRAIAEKYGITGAGARGAYWRYRRFHEMPPGVRRIIREIGPRGVAGLWNAFGVMDRRGTPISRLSELGPENLAPILPNIGKRGAVPLTAFREKNGDMTHADPDRIPHAMRGYRGVQ